MAALSAIEGISTDIENSNDPDLDEEERSFHLLKVSKEDALKVHKHFHSLRMNRIIFSRNSLLKPERSPMKPSFTPQISQNSAKLADKVKGRTLTRGASPDRLNLVDWLLHS